MIPVLLFQEGTLILKEWEDEKPPPCFKWDTRSRSWRTLAIEYPTIIETFQEKSILFEDKAAAFSSLDLSMKKTFDLYDHQIEALQEWEQMNHRGTIILPTGSGKSLVALNAIASLKISVLVVAPTLDLMNQWYDNITDIFEIQTGILGGGYHEIKPVTVTTYDSAYRHMDRYGDLFGLLIFDEIHHLPAATYSQIPELSIAPYRLGLTATYRRMDAKHLQLNHLIGPVVYEKRIRDLKGQHLSDYEIHRIRISLTSEEEKIYQTLHTTYYQFVKEKSIRFYSKGWDYFLKQSAYDPTARKALLARKEMRQIVFNAEKKLETLEAILKLHRNDRVLIFTESNELVYQISIRYLIPAITYQTDSRERKEILDRFRKGSFRFLVTSKVLNEGVDVPEASVAVILGGTASPIEHLQRLGRILRKKSGKKAFLYEIVTGGTQETGISYRRRNADAYK